MQYLTIITFLLLGAIPVQAHFVWLVPDSEAGSSVVHGKFGEEAGDRGVASLEYAEVGVHSNRGRYMDATAGTLNGLDYPETRHYCTVALDVPASGSSAVAENLQHLPQPVTSFGAAIMDGSLYMYGGHTGSAHSYSKGEQSNQLTKLDLKSGQWSTVIEGPHLQGLALVTHGGKLYRIGGFTAENSEGEEHVLNSQDSVACFDPATKAWQTLSSLPECRSSHDAAVVKDTIYVVGGWKMAAGEESRWHTTAWKLNLTTAAPQWEPIAAPPFQRRALALAAHQGKLFVIGGMQKEGGPTTATSIYDPASDSWHDGPNLVIQKSPQNQEAGRGRMSMGNMAGFGASAFATGGSLYVTTVQGTLQRLATDESEWQVMADDITPRFFHRLLPLDNERLIVVGGSNMAIGKFEEVDVISVDNKGNK